MDAWQDASLFRCLDGCMLARQDSRLNVRKVEEVVVRDRACLPNCMTECMND